MSTEGTVVGAAPGPPDDPRALQEEIERTREHLGQTVEALVAKADVKARAQDEASRLIGRLKARAAQARQRGAARAAEARRQAADKTAGPRQQVTARGRHVRQQAATRRRGRGSGRCPSPVRLRSRSGGGQAAAAAAGISKVTPDPVKRAAGNAADTARRRRVPLAAAVGAVGATLLAWLLLKRWSRRR